MNRLGARTRSHRNLLLGRKFILRLTLHSWTFSRPRPAAGRPEREAARPVNRVIWDAVGGFSIEAGGSNPKQADVRVSPGRQTAEVLPIFGGMVNLEDRGWTDFRCDRLAADARAMSARTEIESGGGGANNRRHGLPNNTVSPGGKR